MTYAPCTSGSTDADYGAFLIKTLLALVNLIGGLGWLHGQRTGTNRTAWLVAVIPMSYALLFTGTTVAVFSTALFGCR